MENDRVEDRRRNEVRKLVRQWERTFLMPNPDAYVYAVLDAALGETISPVDQQLPLDLRDSSRQFLFNNPLGRSVDHVEPLIQKESERLFNDAYSTPQFERLLDELSLTVRREFSRIVERFSTHGVRVEIARHSVSVIYPTSARLTWQVLCVDGEVTTISCAGVADVRPFAISRFGAIGASTVGQLVREVYAFLAQVASNGF